MPYNTTAIPPRKEVTGQTLLPLTRVKKIIAVDPDISICSNNAAFVITLATEMFIQHLATEAQNRAKTDRKPRRNIQYKDIATAVTHHDNLEFLQDMVPKTAPYKAVKSDAATTRAKLKGEKTPGTAAAAAAAAATDDRGGPDGAAPTNGAKKQRTLTANGLINGHNNHNISNNNSNGPSPLAPPAAAAAQPVIPALNGFRPRMASDAGGDPNVQLEMEMRQQAAAGSHGGAGEDGDVAMTG